MSFQIGTKFMEGENLSIRLQNWRLIFLPRTWSELIDLSTQIEISTFTETTDHENALQTKVLRVHYYH